MKRRNFIKNLGIGATALSVLPFASCIKSVQKPNIIVFLVDDMGIMDTSVPFLMYASGNPKNYPLNNFFKTPNMENLANQGIRFNNFYAQSVCSPTRASIMTGQNATRHHTTNWIMPSGNNRGEFGPPEWNWEGIKKQDVTLPRLLQKNGYKTIHLGKAHFGPLQHDGADPLNLGFDVNVGGDCWGRPRSYYGEDYYGNHPKYKNNMHNEVPHLEEYHGTDTYLTEALTLEANKHIEKAVDENKPFYLNMAHYAVHSPFMPDPRFEENYKNTEKSEQARSFATMIEGMDKSLGDILAQVKKLGIAENTLIFFLGDNGTDAPLGNQYDIACAAPLRGKKGAHYEGGIRVPFIAAWCEINQKNSWQRKLTIPQGAIQTQIGAVMDILPTITSLVGINIPKEHIIDGYDLGIQLQGKINNNRKNSFLMHYPHGIHRSNYFTCFIKDEWKVIYHYYPEMNKVKSHYQLFNLKEDISESHDLAKKNLRKLKDMMQIMIDQMIAENAQYPIDKNGNDLKPEMPK